MLDKQTIVNVELDEASLASLRAMAGARTVGVDHLIRDAVSAFLQRDRDRKAFDLESEAALEHYTRTGLHVTNDEIGAWIAELEAGNNAAEPPVCHR